MKNSRTLIQGAAIAAAYSALSLAFLPLNFGAVQFRVAEGLTVLPFLFNGAVPGLFVGCIVANLYSPFGLIDIVGGSLASLLAALCTRAISINIKNRTLARALAPLPPVLINAVVIGAILSFVVTDAAGGGAFFAIAGQIFLGQLGACYLLGLPFLYSVEKISKKWIDVKLRPENQD